MVAHCIPVIPALKNLSYRVRPRPLEAETRTLWVQSQHELHDPVSKKGKKTCAQCQYWGGGRCPPKWVAQYVVNESFPKHVTCCSGLLKGTVLFCLPNLKWVCCGCRGSMIGRFMPALRNWSLPLVPSTLLLLHPAVHGTIGCLLCRAVPF